MTASPRVRRVRAAVAAGAALLLLLLGPPGCAAVRAGRILEDALGPAAALADGVAESESRVPFGGEALRVRVFRARGAEGPLPAVLVIHGAAEGGVDDARLVALCRSLAVHGATAAALDLPSLRAFRIDAGDPARAGAAASWLAGRGDLAEEGRVALLGISIGGSYGVLAASDPALRGRVSAVLAFGGYADLGELLRRWMVSPEPGVPGLFDPVREGRRLVFLGNLDRLVPPRDREAAEAALRALLDGRPPPPVPPSLSDGTRLLLAAAASESPLEPAAADSILSPLEGDFAALSPARGAAAPAAPVFLLHAVSDPVVPASDAETLRAALEARGASVEVHVTDLFGHVDRAGAREDPSFLEALPLLWFLADFFDEAGL